MPLDVPIAFCIYNRPELTARVFEVIARQRPRRLLVIGDGARSDFPEDEARVQATRAILDRVDWPCNLQCNFAKQNLGCRRRMATGLDWAFAQAEQLIILEDDCLPHDSFFPFCRDLLDHYQDDPRVMMISGNNFQPGPRTRWSYHFSRWTHIWGWASWRRAWQAYDVNMRSWPEVRLQVDFARQFISGEEFEYWSRIFDQAAAGEIDTWDYAWAYACWAAGGLTILPEVNLVSNLGFGPEATHTHEDVCGLANLPAKAMDFPLQHPPEVQRLERADQYTYDRIFRMAVEQTVAPKQPRSWLPKWMPKLLADHFLQTGER